MNFPTFFSRAILASLLFCAVQASAQIFTTDTEISPFNTNYDGDDIVISNCTVTVDGPHTFASVLVATNGVLTHSFGANGQLDFIVNVTNEQQALSGTNPATLANANVSSPLLVTDLGQTTVYTDGVDYIETTITNGLTDITTEIQRTTDSSIPDGATVLVSYSWDDIVSAGLNLTVTGAVSVASGGSIDANGIGYGAGTGPGAGTSSGGTYFDGSGGGDGGNGGISASNAPGGISYDSLYRPYDLGSGGGASYAGSGGNGGGLVQIAAGGNVNIDGVIAANGGNAMNSRAGGGSGGGIWISAASVSGAGSITANGGAGAPGYGGGGGGGHIAIVCGVNNFAGTTTAYGGSGANYGGAGTVFTQLTGQTGLVLVDNGGNSGAASVISLPVVADVIISGNAALVPSGPFSAHNLTIGTNSILTKMTFGSLVVAATGNLTIQAGGVLSDDDLGFASGGIGGGVAYFSGGYTYCGGGGHGGYGGAAAVTNGAGGNIYDSQEYPTQEGSAGGGDNLLSFGGPGGGYIQLNVSGILQVNGRLSANGGLGMGFAGGGGSGGSINLSAGTLSGTGTIAANGGSSISSLGGGGGGGRIAILCGPDTFSGTMTAYGGAGANYGGAGPVYVQSTASQQLVLDNASNVGPATPLQTAGFANLIVRNGASGTTTSSSQLNFASLLVTSNASLTVPQGYPYDAYFIQSNATFQAGSGININSQGFSGNQGDGGGAGGYMTYSPYAGGGGGNGGIGGTPTNTATGGHGGYQTISDPTLPGAGGGGLIPFSTGGNGGGAVQLTVNGTLQVNGFISANGGNGSGEGGGGGSGGSIYISGGILAGTGAITANGGNGVGTFGGGGGGGCIAINFNTNAFAGVISAYGGGGGAYGGAGTIYFRTNSTGRSSLIVDNNGNAGAGTIIQTSPTTDLTLRNNSIGYVPAGTTTLNNLVVSSNASLMDTNPTAETIINAANVTVQAGGSINANALGYLANSGPGAGRDSGYSPYYTGGGGGYGGYGANSSSNSIGGGPIGIGGIAGYGSSTQPTAPGSGGGGASPYSIGGNGGGAIELNVTGTLQVNGALSVNGGNGSGIGGGGGSGGSLLLNAGNLTGSGVISANGGSGAASVGGGGGGGMIALILTGPPFSQTNPFSGTISAYGGGGANYGGAGTIFIRTNYYNQTMFIVDNGGNRGTNTPVSYSSTLNTLILRNGAVGFLTSIGQSLYGLLITSNAWLVPQFSNPGNIGINLYGSNVVIQAGGGIIADSYGYIQNNGNGRGSGTGNSPFYPCSGAGHGGYGAFSASNYAVGGITYDSVTQPNTSGSGGGGNGTLSVGGSGGGEISLNLLLNGQIQLNGIISANGGNGSGTGGGGGSGGAIYLSANSIIGTGAVTANGGSGTAYGGGGGGGRISINVGNKPATNFFAGTVTAYGGGGANYGGAGTIYYQTNSQNGGSLVLDNNGNVGTNTPFGSSPSGSGPGTANVTVQNGAIGVASGSWQLANVMILSNSAVTAPGNLSLFLNAANITIASGGALSLDGCGAGPQGGPGGASDFFGGAGHGGYGGGNAKFGGAVYDSIQFPTAAGSGGATDKATFGGSGGGVLTLNVSGKLTVNGRLSANGMAGGLGSGGGSGGSLYLANVSSLTGSGVISANGGAGLGTAGGGGGGRIAIYTSSNNFTGQISASGGNGTYPGGAGTIFTRIPGVSESLSINNGGIVGTNTPLSSNFGMPSFPFDLNISGAASVIPLTPLPVLSNLTLAASSTLTMPIAQSSFFVGVWSNATIAGSLNVDHLGYPQTNGPGAGVSNDNEGSGGGYGGVGGASANGAPGGMTYGNPAGPVDFGSGGGSGTPTTTGGSDGGGSLRLSVGGLLTVNGNISANGNNGLQDNSGGGSGGSVWITAGALAGSGTLSASGGDGVLFDGGGGGGGRIAIYTPGNNFTGVTNVDGGTGAFPGDPGSLFLSGGFTNFEIISQSPTGLVMNTVSSVNLTFNDILNPSSISASDFTVMTPSGMASNLNVTVTSPSTIQLTFPTQNLLGTYTVEATTAPVSMFGQSLVQPYTGTFTILLSTISGTVTDTNGSPVAGVLLQPNGGLAGVTTDTNGNYSLGVPPGWNGTVTPSFGAFVFVPDSLSYANVSASLTNQNYLMVQTVTPNLTTSVSGSNFALNWQGVSGVSYQVLWSTNLLSSWQPLGSPIPGTNGPMQTLIPEGSNSTAFFELNASY